MKTQARSATSDYWHAAADKMEIIETVNGISLYADLREWNALQDCFAKHVTLDYSSVFGGTVGQFEPAEIIQEWGWLAGFKATQHLLSSHLVTLQQNTATCRAHVQATHYLPNDWGEHFWQCGGQYDYELMRTNKGWRVSYMKFTLTWARGNQQINALARQQAGELGK